ncbi:hypothetical protein [Polycladidibacter hongkongensis]|uniref:hypothetical protein n=1 Tax=Polycladidibacter hongkongensis TaxID=1647556 RepID=UPI00082E08ED|nr:hypothetical protein [Pseudovibrio hongkongensis]
MSITRIALRYCLVEALKGATEAGDNVEDSAIGALNVDEGGITTNKEAPFISIYTDEAETSFSDGGLQLLGSAKTDVIIEWGISSAMTETDPETGQDTSVTGIPQTDDNMEFTLDLMGRQICDALLPNSSKYAEYFQLLTQKAENMKRERIASDTDGLRLAAHRIVLGLELLGDPVAGDLSLPNPYPELLADMAANAGNDASVKARLILQLLGGAVDDARRYQLENGRSDAELTAIGL